MNAEKINTYKILRVFAWPVYAGYCPSHSLPSFFSPRGRLEAMDHGWRG
jgi:hypothetical protein